MILDLEPLSIQKSQLSDALNATVLTYNGNDGVLQNDMGNTLIQDANTGNIMGLLEGFIPVGMKEHGGVLYLASINKEGEGLIGTIPSPVIRSNVKDHIQINLDLQLADENGPIDTTCVISEKMYPGEKYVMLLKFEQNSITQKSIIGLKPKGTAVNIATEKIPLISQQEVSNQFSQKGGIYSLILFVLNGNGAVETSDLKVLDYYLKNTAILQESSNWWINGNDLLPFDINKMTANLLFLVYPGTVLPGRLAVKLKLNTIKSFDLIPRSDGLQVPYTLRVSEGEEGNKVTTGYMVCIPGFRYTTESGIRVGKIVISACNKDVPTETYTLTSFGIPNVAPKTGKQLTFEVLDDWDDDSKVTFSGVYCYNNDHILINARYNSSKEQSSYLLTCVGDTLNSIVSNAEKCSWAQFGEKTDNSNIGLCHFTLKDYDVWITLNVAYYDLFGGKLGDYKLTFNPYINDHFAAFNTPGIRAADPILIEYDKETYTPPTLTFTSLSYPKLDLSYLATFGIKNSDNPKHYKLYPLNIHTNESQATSTTKYESVTIPLDLEKTWHTTYFGLTVNKYNVTETNELANLQIKWKNPGEKLNHNELEVYTTANDWYFNNDDGKYVNKRNPKALPLYNWSIELNPITAHFSDINILNKDFSKQTNKSFLLFVYSDTNKHSKPTITSNDKLSLEDSITKKYSYTFNKAGNYTTHSLTSINADIKIESFTYWADNLTKFENLQYVAVNNDRGMMDLVLTGLFKNKVVVSSGEMDTKHALKQIIPYFSHIVDNNNLAGKTSTLANFLAINIDTKNKYTQTPNDSIQDGRGFKQLKFLNNALEVTSVEVSGGHAVVINTIGKEWTSFVVKEGDVEKINLTNNDRYFEPIVILNKSDKSKKYNIKLSGTCLYNFGIYAVNIKAENVNVDDGVYKLSDFNSKNAQPIIMPLASVYKEKIANQDNFWMFDKKLTGELYIPEEACYMIYTFNDEDPTKQELWYYQPKDDTKFITDLMKVNNMATSAIDWSFLPDTSNLKKDETGYMNCLLKAYPYANYGKDNATKLNGAIAQLTFNSIYKDYELPNS